MIPIKDYLEYLNEGLIKTYDPNIIINNVKSTLGLLGINNISYQIIIDKIIITISNPNIMGFEKTKKVLDSLNSMIINQGGYFPSNVELTNLLGNTIKRKYDYDFIIGSTISLSKIEITFEAKFPKKENDIPDKLYHLSIKEYEKKIIKYGIYPKSKSKLTSHLDRIYVCKTLKDCEDLIPNMSFYYSDEKYFQIYQLGNKGYNKDIIPQIWEIDNSDRFINDMYLDPNYINGYFILDNIPPNRLKLI